MESEFSKGLRLFADLADQYPELIDESEVHYYGVTPEKARQIVAAFPDVKISVQQQHEIVYFRFILSGLTVEFVGKRDGLATPTIEDGKIVWVLKPEFTQVPA